MKKIRKRFSVPAIILIIIFCILIWLQKPKHRPQEKPREKPREESRQSTKPIPQKTSKTNIRKTIPLYGTTEALQYEVKRVLGSSNRGIAKVSEIERIGITVCIRFTVDDNLTNGWIKSGARSDVVKILKAVQSSGCRYSEVVVFGTFEMMDKFGNSSEDTVLKVSCTRNTINRINWQDFLHDNIYKIADSYWLHPAFR